MVQRLLQNALGLRIELNDPPGLEVLDLAPAGH